MSSTHVARDVTGATAGATMVTPIDQLVPLMDRALPWLIGFTGNDLIHVIASIVGIVFVYDVIVNRNK